MQSGTIKVGTLAKKTGLTVRTLHYYEEIGLLVPAARSSAGYRLYSTQDVARLQQICSLRQLGFSLDAIREALATPTFAAQRIVAMHRAHLQKQIAQQLQLARQLELLAAYLEEAGPVPMEQFIQTIEDIIMLDKYYTPEQRDLLDARAEALGADGLEAAQNQWSKLIAAVRAQMEAGAEPTSEPVVALARQWREMVAAFTGGHPGIAQSLQTMYAEEGPEKASRGMMDGAIWGYISQAMAALD